MKHLLAIAAVLALATAKPELYKENEDFQYSRSSTDEGSKSGFYGAQRGNMGGNYERAHNMDGLAQNQMSGLVRQVEGELGEGSNTRTGSVYTSANSRGIYGSGRYDLSNLQGRNFQEGTNYEDSQSHSSLSSHNSAYTGHSASSMHNSAYNSQSRSSGLSGYHGTKNHRQLQAGNLQAAGNVYDTTDTYNYGHDSAHNSGYQGTKNHGQVHTGNLQAADNVHDTTDAYSAHAANHNSQSTSHSFGHHSQSGYHSESEYDSSANQHSASYGVNPRTRLIATPVRIYGTPGQRYAIPVGAQIYDAGQTATVDQNAINSEAEVLNNADQQVNYRPTNTGKRYESSYSYRKQWERHNTNTEAVALSIPTENPFPNKNSELYDDSLVQTSNNQLHSTGSHSQRAHSSNAYNYNANTHASSSSQSRHHLSSEAQHSSDAATSASNAYTHGGHNSGSLIDGTNALGSADSTPKSYQSSYSYHKSWERQGDPYIIPVNGPAAGQEAQRLTAAANSNTGYASHRYGTHYSTGHATQIDCDENGHMRVARSAQNQYRYGQFDDNDQQQQAQNTWDPSLNARLEDLGQETQSQWGGLEEFGQHNQNNWENLQQQTQTRWDKLQVGQRQTYVEPQRQAVQANTGKLADMQPSQLTGSPWIGTGNRWLEFQNPWDSLHEQQLNAVADQETQWINAQFFETQTQNDYYKHHNDQNVEQFEKNYLEPQDQSEDLSQQTQTILGIADSFDRNKNKNHTGPVWHQQENTRPVWEQLEDLHKIKNTSQSNSTFSSLWDKISYFEETSTTNAINTEQRNSSANLTNSVSHASWNQHAQSSDTSDYMDLSQHVYDQDNFKNIYNDKNYIQQNSSGYQDTQLHIGSEYDIKNASTTYRPMILSAAPISINKTTSFERPLDIGRGDIGPEETVTEEEPFNPLDTPAYRFMPNTNFEHHTSEKNSSHIEIINQEHRLDNNSKYNNIPPRSNHSFELPTGLEDYSKQNKTLEETYSLHKTIDRSKVFENQQSENSNDMQFDEKVKLLTNSLKHQSQQEQIQDFENQSVVPIDTYISNNSQKVQDKHKFDSQLTVLNQALQQVNKTNQQNSANKSNTLQEASHFDQVSENFDQETGDFEQQSENFEQQTGNFEQQAGNFEQQTGNFEQQTGNFEQQTSNFEQQTGKFEQQTGHFEQQTGNFEQQTGNLEQQTGNFEQQTGNFEQQTGNFEQQTGNFEQQTGKFEKNGNFKQQIEQQTGTFEQRTGNFKQQSGSFDQQTGNSQKITKSDQNIANFEKQTGIEQEFGHYSSILDRDKIHNTSNQLQQGTLNVNQQSREPDENTHINQHIPEESYSHNKNLNQPNKNINQEMAAVWGQSLQEFLKEPETKQPLAENFGQYSYEKGETQHFQAPQLAESFSSHVEQRPNDFYKESHSLPRTGGLPTPPEGAQHENTQDLRKIEKTENPRAAQISKQVQTPVETTTQKTGFWTSVGSKLSNAKNKVASWFYSSLTI